MGLDNKVTAERYRTIKNYIEQHDLGTAPFPLHQEPQNPDTGIVTQCLVKLGECVQFLCGRL